VSTDGIGIHGIDQLVELDRGKSNGQVLSVANIGKP
jgi:hypothetical protein